MLKLKRFFTTGSVVLLVLSILSFVSYKNNSFEPSLVHRTYTGTIVSYIQVDDKNGFVLDKFSSIENYEFLFDENTVWFGTEFEEKIKGQETGLKVVVETEFYEGSLENEPYGYYPVLMISPLEPGRTI